MTTYPVRKCPETKYADEMVRTGFLFNWSLLPPRRYCSGSTI